MAFKYINPGLVLMSDEPGRYHTVDKKNKTVSNVVDGTCLGEVEERIFLPKETKEMFIKFDYYISNVYANPADYVGACINFSDNKYIRIGADGSVDRNVFIVRDYRSNKNVFSTGSFWSVIFSNYAHIWIADSKYYIDYYYNGLKYSYENTAPDGLTISNVFIRCNGDRSYMSNIIISDEWFDIAERVVKMPTETISNPYTKADNNFNVRESGEVIVKYDDTNPENFDDDTCITGTNLVFRKLYRDGVGLNNTTLFINDNEVMNREILINEKLKRYYSVKQDNVNINDFGNMQFKCQIS